MLRDYQNLFKILITYKKVNIYQQVGENFDTMFIQLSTYCGIY